ncbi:helix-turn-helix domain-containing protein [Exiguobacterium sp. MMG028]|uniref:PucR family transcriptional regulator n=1 Tax=Exiguobacterium sp. MMG028 TaxID=3021979 RepID=UPI0022FDF889|nr:PucR family transcriptional regulator [Exiguobacterium sp. MMG028]MDA5560500.1 helix-turn-helix domain-containing protein [Exiguobacterium sp. MMG028]
MIVLNTFDRIKAIFPTAVHRSEDASGDLDWFETQDGTIFGLPAFELTEREQQLLRMWATPFLQSDPHQRKWQERLQDETYRLEQSFRLISLSLQEAEEEAIESFISIIHDFMPHAEIVLITTKHIELIERDTFVDLQEFEDVLRAIASDCFIEAHAVYSERSQGPLARVYRQHQLLMPYARLSTKTYPASQLLYHYLLQEQDLKERNHITASLMEMLDLSTIELLEALFSHSLNVSHTAKALFMHRNTLNYRLDRLFETTGYDARKFYDASLLQLMVTLHKSD